jgi:hypothetical protein
MSNTPEPILSKFGEERMCKWQSHIVRGSIEKNQGTTTVRLAWIDQPVFQAPQIPPKW